jgi:hypothetical protein
MQVSTDSGFGVDSVPGFVPPSARSDQVRAEAEELLLHEVKGAHAVFRASEDECIFGRGEEHPREVRRLRLPVRATIPNAWSMSDPAYPHRKVSTFHSRMPLGSTTASVTKGSCARNSSAFCLLSKTAMDPFATGSSKVPMANSPPSRANAST